MRDLRYTLDTMFDEKIQQAFARYMGWEDTEQMLYYEEMAEREFLLQVQSLPSPPGSLFTTNTNTLDLVGVY